MFGGGGGGYYREPVGIDQQELEVKESAEEAARKERMMARKRKGRSSTILTSGLGLTDDPALKYAGKRTLGE